MLQNSVRSGTTICLEHFGHTHDSTGEKPSMAYCRTPTEAALLPTHPVEPTEVSDYRGVN